MRISDWSSDVCSSDLLWRPGRDHRGALRQLRRADWIEAVKLAAIGNLLYYLCLASAIQRAGGPLPTMIIGTLPVVIAISANLRNARRDRSEEHTSELQSLMRISYAVFCLKKKKKNNT